MRNKEKHDPMGALPHNSPTRTADPARPAAPQTTAAVTLAWIRALASDWTERRENEEEDERPDSRGPRR